MIKHIILLTTLVPLPLVGSSGDIVTDKQTRCSEEVHLVIQFEAKGEYLPEFLNIIENIEIDMANEPGFQSAVVYQDIDDPNRFTLIEAWQSRDAHAAHFDRIVASGDWKYILSLQQNPPVMGYARNLQC